MTAVQSVLGDDKKGLFIDHKKAMFTVTHSLCVVMRVTRSLERSTHSRSGGSLL